MRRRLTHKTTRKGAMGLVGGLALAASTIAVAPFASGIEVDTVDLTTGAVFAMSNDRAGGGSRGNEVVAYDRDPDGSLQEAGRFPTGGTGSGSFEDSANGLVLGTSAGEAAPNNLIELADGGQQLLFATNAGSNTISVFQVRPEGLALVDVQDSGGEKPVSITVNRGIAYVLNSGETNDDLFDGAGNVIDNCTTGNRPAITGFRVTPAGQLSRLSGSTRGLSSRSTSGCAQVSFNPSGTQLTVTERLAQPRRLGQQTNADERLDDEGVIDTFDISRSGRPSGPWLTDATGQGPFGFTFTKGGNLLTTEQSDGPTAPAAVPRPATSRTGEVGSCEAPRRSRTAAPTPAGSSPPTARPSPSPPASSVRVGSPATSSTTSAWRD